MVKALPAALWRLPEISVEADGEVALAVLTSPLPVLVLLLRIER